MSRAKFLRRSLIESGIGGAVGAALSSGSAIAGGENIEDVGFSALAGGLGGAALSSAFGQTMRSSRVKSRFDKDMASSTRYQSMASNLKDAESRKPFLQAQLNAWDKATEMEEAYRNMVSQSIMPESIQRIRKTTAFKGLKSFKDLESAQEGIQKSIRKYEEGGIRGSVLDSLQKKKDIAQGRAKSAIPRKGGKTESRLSRGYEFQGMNKDLASQEARQDILEIQRIRGKGLGDTMYAVPTGNNYSPVIQIEPTMDGNLQIKSTVKGYKRSNVRKGDTPTHIVYKDSKLGQRIVRKPKGKGIKDSAGQEVKSFVSLSPVEYKAGTPFSDLKGKGFTLVSSKAGYRGISSPPPFAQKNLPEMTRTAPKGVRYGRSMTPEELRFRGVSQSDLSASAKHHLKNTNLEGKAADYKRSIDRHKRTLSNLKDMQRRLSDVSKDVSTKVREKREAIVAETRKPQQIQEEMKDFRQNLREQLENDIYGKWFGIF